MKKTSLFNIDMSFQKEQLEGIVKKIKIIDGSCDVIKEKEALINYYNTKWHDFKINKNNIEFIDLFCGAGGLSIGLEQEGLYPILAVDKDQSAIATYRFNRPWLNADMIIQDDIKEISQNYSFPHVPLIVGGPPCQGFSVANKQKKENDERNELYKFYVNTVEKSAPEIFLMENVEGILQIYDYIKKDFQKIGYTTCTPIVLNAKDFGFPQSRKRAFILGINNRIEHQKDLYELFVSEIKSHLNSPRFCLGDAIGDLPPLKAKTLKNSTYVESKDWGFTLCEGSQKSNDYLKLINYGLSQNAPLLNHKSKYNNERDIQIFSILKQGEKSDAESIQSLNPYKNRDDIFKDKFHKLVMADPCKAITAHMYYDCNMYIHPNQARGLTPREAARVQGFPDDYLFLGSPNEWYRQIGNAVSPLMARILAKGLKKVIRRIHKA